MSSIFGRSAVCGFKDSCLVANICPRRHTQTAYLGGTCIRDIITIEIRRGNHVVFLWSKKHLLKHGIGNPVLYNNLPFWGNTAIYLLDTFFCNCKFSEFLSSYLIAPLTKSALRKFHNITLMHKGHTLFPFINGILDGASYQSF